jgi:hypothetical protein
MFLQIGMFFDSIKNTLTEDDQVEYIEDCFQDLERPKFGWRVKITLKEEEPCDLNIENPSLSTCGLNSNPASKKYDLDYLTHFAQNRQTLEEFRSSAPPDCRLVTGLKK